MVHGLNIGWTSTQIGVEDVKNEMGPEAELGKRSVGTSREVMGKEETSGLENCVSCNVSFAKINCQAGMICTFYHNG